MQRQWDDYEWDEAKCRENVEKHHIDFAEVWSFQWRSARIEPSPRSGEMRYLACGYINDRLHTLVFTLRGEKCRIISLRKASPREIRTYAEA